MEKRLGTVGREVEKGDRIFVRLMKHGEVLLEVIMDSVESVQELFRELRRQYVGLSGLTRMYMRNISRGWSEERAVMFRG